MYGNTIKKRSDKIACLFQEKTSTKKEKKNRAKLCRFKTAAWASLLQVEETTKCERTSSPHSRMPEHEEDCHIPIQTGIDMWEPFSVSKIQ